MRHRIVVLGAGYAGAGTAGSLARYLHRDDVEITVVNANSTFVERMRLHEVAAGHDSRSYDLAAAFAGTGIQLRQALVTTIDADQRTVTVTDSDGAEQLEYDTLVYALGSTASDGGVPGVFEHALHIAGRETAVRLRDRLNAMTSGRVLVVGGNLTAIEGATEIAESHPDLKVVLVTRSELGGWLGPKARRHLLRAFDRLGIELHEHTTIERVTATGAVAADGSTFTSDVTVWTAGFAVHPIAGEGGLKVADNNQIVVDRMMRSVSHPEVYAVGDSAYAMGDNGKPMPMSCASAGFTRIQAVSTIVGDLTGHKITQSALAYYGNTISLGRKDGIFQVVDKNAQSKTWSLRGRAMATFKEGVVRGAGWAARKPTAGLPTRTYRVTTAPRRSTVTTGS